MEAKFKKAGEDVDLTFKSDGSSNAIARTMWGILLWLGIAILIGWLWPKATKAMLLKMIAAAERAKKHYWPKLRKGWRALVETIISWSHDGLDYVIKTLWVGSLTTLAVFVTYVLCLASGSPLLIALSGILLSVWGLVLMIPLKVLPKKYFPKAEEWVSSLKTGILVPMAVGILATTVPLGRMPATTLLILLFIGMFFIVFGLANIAKRLAVITVLFGVTFQFVGNVVPAMSTGVVGGWAANWSTDIMAWDLLNLNESEVKQEDLHMAKVHKYGSVSDTLWTICSFTPVPVGKDSFLVLSARDTALLPGTELEVLTLQQIKTIAAEDRDKLLAQIADTARGFSARARVALFDPPDVRFVTFKDELQRKAWRKSNRIKIFVVPWDKVRLDANITAAVAGSPSADKVGGATQQTPSKTYPLFGMSKGKELSASIPVTDLQARKVEGSDSSWTVDIPANIGVAAISGIEAASGQALRFTFESSTVGVNMKSGEPEKDKWFGYTGDPGPWGFQGIDWMDEGLEKSGSFRVLGTGKYCAILVDTDGQFNPMFLAPNKSQDHTVGDIARRPIHVAWNDLWIQRWTDNYKKYPREKFVEYRALHRTGVMRVTITLATSNSGSDGKLVARSGGQ